MTQEHGSALFLCSCLGSMEVDAAALGRAATGTACRLHRHLCRSESHLVAGALEAGQAVTVACGQEAPVFEDLAQGRPLTTIDIRDRAGWSDEGAAALPKMAALLAEGALSPRPAPLMPIVSEGVCLVYGPGDVAMDAAERLAGRLSVTVMLSDVGEVIPPREDRFEILRGRIRAARGRLGAFSLVADGLAVAEPAGRGALRFGPAADGGASECDIILDLSGGTPLFPAPDKRDGYLRADPRDQAAVARALLEASNLTGTFDKPLHVRVTESLCAHSRAGKTGCTRCLDVCPTGAILPQGDHVSLAADICAGCGACAAVCPTGAMLYDDPPLDHQVRRLRVMAEAYRAAGGAAPRLLLHDAGHGAEMIALSARFGRGLPADVLPLELPETGGAGHTLILAALSQGYAEVALLAGPRTEREGLDPQLALARALAPEPGRIRLLDPAEPDALETALYDTRPSAPQAEPALALGGGRELVRAAMRALGAGLDAPVPLPEGAPYGAVLVDQEACTLCLACVSLCPTGALLDNPDRPELRFQEDACVQCGICAAACPETAITLEPRYDASAEALKPRVLNSEEPFACIECGKEFGVRSTIERITEKLRDRNWMYTNSDNLRLIQMCDDCRVQAQFIGDGGPMGIAPRPTVRTTDDYLDARDGPRGRGPRRGDA
ncbi:4Fe-4S dicluster domain-containing protein [Paroceanicella profunda]|uniref:4Fe-4S dicluster domain-containing protein n=1 Tax=Paroceanicella profunda TaxID=2579971 RepID=A0A5B8G076_9RHOB|nr:4Fe-4S binding protein [Paroceanicella profunda]QDL92439.1 4Fe-4S dicluster domain-containing protein [Paroceanicella profunda]